MSRNRGIAPLKKKQRGVWSTGRRVSNVLTPSWPPKPWAKAATLQHFNLTAVTTTDCKIARSVQREDSVAHNLTVDQDVNAIGANSKCARVQVIDVLAAIGSE